MPPATGSALLILVAFVLPGFVAILVAERTYQLRVADRSPFELLLLTSYYSVLTYAVAALLAGFLGYSRVGIERAYRHDPLWKAGLAGTLVIVVIPLIIATSGRLWHDLRGSLLSKPTDGRLAKLGSYLLFGSSIEHQTPSAWDHWFQLKRGAMVRAALKDGSFVAGFYGDESFAAYGAHGGDLFLEQRWGLDSDNWFSQGLQNSRGVWISGSGGDSPCMDRLVRFGGIFVSLALLSVLWVTRGHYHVPGWSVAVIVGLLVFTVALAVLDGLTHSRR